MTSSTFACLMPLSSALNAAVTPSEPGAVFPVVVPVFFGAGFGVAAGVGDFCVSVATGFVRLVLVVVRWRFVVVDEFEFCAQTTPHVKTNVSSKPNSFAID